MNRIISRYHFPSRLVLCTAAVAFLFGLEQRASVHAQAAHAAAPAQAAPVAAPVAVPTVQAPATTTTTTAPAAGAVNPNATAANPATQRAGGVEGATIAEAPTQFQQMVATSTDRVLPIFGASLFNGVPSTFAPVNDVPVGPGYILGPGDTVSIQTVGQVSLQYNLPVDNTGAINVPNLGPVHVAGVPYGQLADFLTRQFSRLYRGFTLTANLGTLRTIQVFVVGQARRPGTYSISSLSTLLNAIFASGGPASDGSLRDIQVKRDGQTIVHFDLYDLLLRGDKTHDVRLQSGDVIFIPFVGPQIAVTGSVNTPAIYEMRGATTIGDAIVLAGGETAVASPDYARLERIYEHSMRSVEDVSLATQSSQPLRNGDILTISSIVERFRNAVTLRGNVANAGRYSWHTGMRLSDLFPDKASLITRNYWNKRNQLGQTVQDYNPTTGISSQAGQGALQVSGTAAEREAANPTLTTQERTGNGTGGTGSQTGETGTGSGESANAGTRPSSSSAAGTTVSSALTGTNTTFSAQNDVVLSAPDIDWSYAVIERLSAQDLKTSLIPFNLGRLVLDGDASQNFELQPGDVVTVFSTADIRVPTAQQTRFVRLEGEFLAPGVYSVRPGETLRSLLARAGGFTPDAYLYASEFTRDSVRRVEMQRLREYADELDAQISAVTANNTARAITGSDQVSAAVSETDARRAVSRLRQVQPVGRIVLDLRPNSAGIDSVPDLALEDGDRFIVPRVPSSVMVEGQVYNANAFVFRPGERMRDYLHRAGGPDREADKKRAFVLRADGSVVSEQYTDVKRAPVFPGDTIVVPPVIDRRAIFQRVVDIASIATNFGFSAATLYLLSRQ